MSVIAKIINTFTTPGKVFEEVKDFEWKKALIPLLILAVVGVIAYLPIQNLSAEYGYDKTVNFLENSDRISDEAKAEAIQKAEESLDKPQVGGYITAFIQTPIRVLFMALIALIIGNTFMGGGAKFGQMLNITAWAYMVNILESIIKVPLMLKKWTIEVYTGLGVLGIGEEGSFIYAFLNGFDLFAFWRIVLIAIGMGIIYSKKTKPYLIALLIFWVLMITVLAGIQSIIGGMFS